MNPRQHPRTMREAFGPYTSDKLQSIPDRGSFWTPVRIALACTYAAALLVLVVVI